MIKGSYSVPLAVLRKRRPRRLNHDASDDPFLDKPFFDDTRIYNTVQCSYEEYLLRRKARMIFERQKPQEMLMLDRGLTKEQSAAMANWLNPTDDMQEDK